MDSERTCWAEGMGLSKSFVEALTLIAEEAQSRGLDVYLPPGDIGEWGIALDDAGAEDLADRVRELEARRGGGGAVNAKIIEQGNGGFPDAGDYCQGDGQLYRVVSVTGRIHIDERSGRGNFVHAEVEPAEWSECDESAEHSARVEVVS